MELNNKPLIVFSHLRWEFVFQRPQHLLTRIAKNTKVYFIEEPITVDNGGNNQVKTFLDGNIKVIQPIIDRANLITELLPIIKDQVLKFESETPNLWFYSPEFVEIIDLLDHKLVIYDCMDQLTSFKGASAQLLDQEKKLLAKADIVFTGGKSLFEEKKKFAAEVYCFPSSVNAEQFKKATAVNTLIPDDLKNISHPIVGYCGVIDERINYSLLKEVARLRPLVTFYMIGPVVKVSQDELAQEPNIIYIGSRPYEQLPNYLKGIDIAIMPFALNESTKFISPTKTLEYMAAEKPIISTPIFDVVRDYKEVVAIINTAEEFAEEIDTYLNEPQNIKQQRINKYDEILAKTSWDKTAAQMLEIVNSKL